MLINIALIYYNDLTKSTIKGILDLNALKNLVIVWL